MLRSRSPLLCAWFVAACSASSGSPAAGDAATASDRASALGTQIVAHLRVRDGDPAHLGDSGIPDRPLTNVSCSVTGSRPLRLTFQGDYCTGSRCLRLRGTAVPDEGFYELIWPDATGRSTTVAGGFVRFDAYRDAVPPYVDAELEGAAINIEGGGYRINFAVSRCPIL